MRADRFDSGFFAHCLTDARRACRKRCSTRSISATCANFRRSCLEGVDAVVHLAAISNDPMGKRFEAVTDAINHRRQRRARRGGGSGAA